MNALEREALNSALVQFRDLAKGYPASELFEPLPDTIQRIERVLGLEPGEEL